MVSSCFKCRSVSDVRSFLNVISVSSAIVYLKMTSVIYLMNISNIPIVIFVFWPNKNWFNSRLVTPRPVPSCQILSPRRSEKIRELCAAGFAVGSATSFSLCTWHIMAHHGTSLHLPPVRLFACFSFGTSFLEPCFTSGVPGFGYAACFLWKHEKRWIENHELNRIKCCNQLSQFGILKH